MKKLLSALTAAALLCVWTIPCAAALAEDDAGDCVIVYDDSGYQVTELEMATEDSSSPSVFSLSTVTGRKTVTRYDSRDRRLFSFTLTATFSYNGSTASATSASYSYRIYDSSWDFSSGLHPPFQEQRLRHRQIQPRLVYQDRHPQAHLLRTRTALLTTYFAPSIRWGRFFSTLWFCSNILLFFQARTANPPMDAPRDHLL